MHKLQIVVILFTAPECVCELLIKTAKQPCSVHQGLVLEGGLVADPGGWFRSFLQIADSYGSCEVPQEGAESRRPAAGRRQRQTDMEKAYWGP